MYKFSLISIVISQNLKNLFLVLKAKFNFAVMAAGFQSYCTPHRCYYESQINLPSLHIYGETDAVIPIGLYCKLDNEKT